MAQGQQQERGAQQAVAGDGLPEGLKIYSPYPFKGMDAKGSAFSIDDQNFAWIENAVFIGDGQLALLGSNGLPLYTVPAGLTFNSYGFFQLNNVPYIAIFLSDGSGVRIPIGGGAPVTIAPSGTFDTSEPIAISSWAGQFLLIGTNSAYYAWDGTSLFGPGTLAPQVQVTGGGENYTSPPTITIQGGSGTGATFQGVLSSGTLVQINVTNPGHGYLPTDGGALQIIITGGGNPNRLAQATATIGGGGVLAVQILDGGTGYTNEPSVTFSGGGASTQATAVAEGTANSITAVLMVTPGVGYTSTPTVTFGAPSGGGDTATGIALIGINGITAINVTDGGAGYTSSPQVVITDPLGFGTGAVAVAQVSGGVVTGVQVLNPGHGYSAAVITFVGGNPTVATATASLMPQGGKNPVSATAMQVFKDRVWMVNGNNRYTSTAGSISDFAASAGGVVAQNNDNDLVYQLFGLAQTSGFLYEFGDSSVNAISNPTSSTTNNVTTTNYTVTNIDPQIGCRWPRTIQPFGEAVVFANPLGVFAIYGGTVRKISEELDDLFVNVSGTPGGLTPSAAIVILFGIKFYALAISLFDPLQQQQRQLILLWDGQRWFTATQDAAIKGLTTINTGGATDVYYEGFGDDGTRLYRCFLTPSATLQKRFVSKFYGSEAIVQYKQALRFYVVGEQPFTYNVTLHSDTAGDLPLPTQTYPVPGRSSPYGLPMSPQGMDAQGAAGLFLGWTLTTMQPSGNIDYMGLAYRYYSANY